MKHGHRFLMGPWRRLVERFEQGAEVPGDTRLAGAYGLCQTRGIGR